MVDIEVGQRWTHKLTDMSFQVVLVDDDEVLLDPEGEGTELTITPQVLVQEFRCPGVRRSNAKKPSRRIKPGKIRRGLRR